MAGKDFVAELIEIISRGLSTQILKGRNGTGPVSVPERARPRPLFSRGRLLELPIESVVLPVLDLDSML